MDKENVFPTRKQIRMPEFSYSENRMYFITICSKDKKKTFGSVVGYGARDVPMVSLSLYGKVIEKYICLMAYKYDNVFVDHYVIMPNHVHMLIAICPPPETKHNKTTRVSYFGALTDILPECDYEKQQHAHTFGTSRAPYPTQPFDNKNTLTGNDSRANEIIPKFISLFKRYCNHEIGHNIWQKRYYDHVIRSYKEYRNAYLYIDNNPAHWAEDRYFL